MVYENHKSCGKKEGIYHSKKMQWWLASGYHAWKKSILSVYFIYSFTFLLKIVDSIILVSVVQHSDSICTKQCYWLGSLCCTLHLCDIYFINSSLYLLTLFTYFTHSPIPSPLATTSLFFVSVSISVLFYLFICFVLLDLPCKWKHTVIVFLCLT